METAMIAAEAAGPGTARRRRESVVSLITCLVAFALGLGLLYGVLQQGPHGLLRWVDVLAGAAACAALFWRRRAPLVIAVTLALVSAFVASAGAANMFALYALARYRRLSSAIAVAVLIIACGVVFWRIYPGNNRLDLTITVNAAIAAAAVAWGAFRRSQAALITSLRERAARAERERALEQERGRLAERSRIAREMHDAVAHRVSLIALHAGGLEIAPDPPAETVHTSARMIRSAAVVALEELRAALGVLRSGEPGSLEQPGVDRLDDLVTDARTAGQQVTLITDDLSGLSDTLGRDVYRIVQEGLTNARKHAAGQPVEVVIRREDGELVVTVGNDLPESRSEASLGLPGSGTGLVGLAERVHLAGGTWEHGSVDGRFTVKGRLPWRPRS